MRSAEKLRFSVVIRVTSRSFRHYIFIDESGGIAQKSVAHVITCAAVTSDWRSLAQIVRATRQRSALLGKKSILHAAVDDPLIVEFLLNQAAQMNSICFVASILDKQYYLDRSYHPNELYQAMIAFTVQRALATLQISLADAFVVLERSFTKDALNQSLRKNVACSVDMAESQVQVARKDSNEWGFGLQVADYASWSLFQKYERQEHRFASIIQAKIAAEDRIGFTSGTIRPVESFWK
jgi:hypothetical protein